MKPLLFFLIIAPRSLLAIVNMIVGIESPCQSLIDCLSLNNSRTICYQGYCQPCRESSQSCSSSLHCCAGSRCYRHRCTPMFPTGHSCRFHRQCRDSNDFCINQKCTRCLPLRSPCSSHPLATPCCVGLGICRHGICQPALLETQPCSSTFDCAEDLICLEGRCQNPLGEC